MKNLKINNRKGIVFWITGLSGSGKTRLGHKIKKSIIKNYGPTILFSGDDIRNIFEFKKYSLKDRLKIVTGYSRLCYNLSNQGINIIFCVVGLMHSIHKWNRKNIKNYIEIYIKSPLNKVKKLSKKKIYKQKYIQNVVGFDIKPEFPKKPNIIINNNFSKSLDKLSKELLTKINKATKLNNRISR
tara:strand:+ start:74 stop:628 length:555 start_codon:yes stop_codon:yes gene_type:complete